MTDEVRCFHNHPPETTPGHSLVEGQATEGVVVCVHVYGLGVYLPEQQTFGHVNTPAMGVERASTLDDYPSVGTQLSLRSLGYAGSQRQLRLQVES